MYAKLVDGKPEILKSNFLTYTVEENGILYYVNAVNPCETELNKAGYYKLIAEDEDIKGEDTLYELKDNTIVVKRDNYEEAPVQ